LEFFKCNCSSLCTIEANNFFFLLWLLSLKTRKFKQTIEEALQRAVEAVREAVEAVREAVEAAREQHGRRGPVETVRSRRCR
jgi:putative component of toxin-antitoxin plasmid stabilization module